MSTWNFEEIIAVSCGLFVTLLSTGFVLYWIVQERRDTGSRGDAHGDSSSRKADNARTQDSENTDLT